MRVGGKVAVAVAACLGLLGIPLSSWAREVEGQVLSIGDGDTLRVSVDGEAITVRASCIDSPELAQQPWGENARIRLAEMRPIDTPVRLRVTDTDRYGRTVAEVFTDGRSVNLQMVGEGLAVVYTQYLSACEGDRDAYLQAEAAARENRLGFWNQSEPVIPWDFRRGVRQGAAIQQPESTPPLDVAQRCDPAYPDVCIPSPPPDLDCGDIPHRRFQVLSPDPHRFDGDRDGIGCER